MMVDFGLPWSSNTRMRDDIDSTFTRFSLALEERRKPTPPTVEPEVFLVAEEVMSWYEPTL